MADAPDRIECLRTGGFANIPMRASLPLAELTPDERAASSGLALWPPTAGEATAGNPDGYQYDITLVTGERRRTVRLREPGLDAATRALIARLERDGSQTQGTEP